MDELRPLRLFRDQIPEHDEAARAIARARLADEQRHWEGRASAIARTGRTWQLPFGQRLSRRVLVFVVLLMQIALLASPAVGVVGYVRDLFEGTPPTPLVQQHFNQWDEAMATLPNHPPHRPGNWDVDTSKVHGVIAVQTPDGPLYLWAAPIREGGGQCWLLQFANDSNPEDTLYGPSGRDGTLPGESDKIHWWGTIHHEAHRTMGILVGEAGGDAASVVAELPDHSTFRLPVVETFFVAPIDPSATILKVTAYDSNGKPIDESTQSAF